MNDPLAIATRIVTLRLELRAAEEEFQKLVVGARPQRRTKVAPSSGPVAAQVRELLQTAGRPLTFGEIHDAMPDARREAIKSALKKARDGGSVQFRGFKYSWQTKRPAPVRRSASVVSGVQAPGA